MKKASQLAGLALAICAVAFTGCTKKPLRSETPATSTGPAPADTTATINPNEVAVPAEAAPALPQREAGVPENPDKSVVDPIYFALDRSAVAPAERPKLDAALKWLKDNPDKNLVLVGHCDWRGTAEYNLGLGDRRANAVKKFLEAKGADTKRLETLSKGSQDAKQSGSEADWKLDRRVDFIVLKRDAAPPPATK